MRSETSELVYLTHIHLLRKMDTRSPRWRLALLTGLKKQAGIATGNFYKLQEELLENPATKAVIKQTTAALESLEVEAHKSFCNCINDPPHEGSGYPILESHQANI